MGKWWGLSFIHTLGTKCLVISTTLSQFIRYSIFVCLLFSYPDINHFFIIFLFCAIWPNADFLLWLLICICFDLFMESCICWMMFLKGGLGTSWIWIDQISLELIVYSGAQIFGSELIFFFTMFVFYDFFLYLFTLGHRDNKHNVMLCCWNLHFIYCFVLLLLFFYSGKIITLKHI